MAKLMHTFNIWGVVLVTLFFAVPFMVSNPFSPISEGLGLLLGIALWVFLGLFPLEIIGRLIGTKKTAYPNLIEFIAYTIIGLVTNTVLVRLFMYIFN